jgi:hypothetical protein
MKPRIFSPPPLLLSPCGDGKGNDDAMHLFVSIMSGEDKICISMYQVEAALITELVLLPLVKPNREDWGQ